MSFRAELLLLFVAAARSAVIQRITGEGEAQLTRLSAFGGTNVYIIGTNLGTAFDPPTICIAGRCDGQCTLKEFTSSRKRLHSIMDSFGLPAPASGCVGSGPIRIPTLLLPHAKRGNVPHRAYTGLAVPRASLLARVVASTGDGRYLTRQIFAGHRPARVHRATDPDERHAGRTCPGGCLQAQHSADQAATLPDQGR